MAATQQHPKPVAGKRRPSATAWCCVLALAGCAFDISHVKTEPAPFTANPGCGPAWSLAKGESVDVHTGFPTVLRQGTRWHCTGSVSAGQVYKTDDQIVTVEASNIFEAMAVIQGDRLVGFYLPVEQSVVPVTPPVSLSIKAE